MGRVAQEDDASTVRELSLGIERSSRICKDKRIMQRDVLVDAVLNGAPNRTGTPRRSLMAMSQASCRGPTPRSQALPKLTNRSSKKTLGALQLGPQSARVWNGTSRVALS